MHIHGDFRGRGTDLERSTPGRGVPVDAARVVTGLVLA